MFSKQEFFEDLIAYYTPMIPAFDIYNTIAPKETKTPYAVITLDKKRLIDTMQNEEHGIAVLDLSFDFAIDRDQYASADTAVELTEHFIWGFEDRKGFSPVKNKSETTYKQTEDMYIATFKMTIQLEF